MIRQAVFSPCRAYRYALERLWGEPPYPTFIGFNPSTADAKVDDPTIRRLIGFASDWGYGGFTIVNLYAYISANPKAVHTAEEPIGPNNYPHLDRAINLGGPVIAIWGAQGKADGRDRRVIDLADRRGIPLLCMGHNKDGSPRHPLYLPNGTMLEPL